MKKLSKEQMKVLKGGETAPQPGQCCWHNAGWYAYDCDMTQAQAIANQESTGGFWCCDSCVSSYNAAHGG